MSWSRWELHQRAGHNVYADWFNELKGENAASRFQGSEIFEKANISSLIASSLIPEDPLIRLFPDALSPLQLQLSGGSAISNPVGARGTGKRIAAEYGQVVAPSFAMNEFFKCFMKNPGPEIPDNLPVLDPDTIIVGVIDTGIALGHRSTRLEDGTTRVAMAWQQVADISGDSDQAKELRKKQAYLPFGREYSDADINAKLAEHSTGNDIRTGWLDEEAFNRDLGLVDFVNARGHRMLSTPVAHGTHVLDRAVGYDPVEDAELARRIRIIAVNLPPRDVMGLSGAYLEQYVIAGIARIVKLADELYAKSVREHKTSNIGDEMGFPVVINFSFGKQAGSKDGTGPLARLIDDINDRRTDPSQVGSSPFRKVYLVAPVGNDNLTRSNAIFDVGAEPVDLMLRVQPQDQSSNYVEIWSDPIKGSYDQASELPLQVSVRLPDGTEAEFQPARPDQIREIEQTARLYAEVKQIDGPDNDASYRIRYVLCTAPTLLHESGDPPKAPAGLWRIGLKCTGKQTVTVSCRVQTDQSILPSGATGLRAYFVDKDYRRYDETTGRPIDSFDYEYGCDPPEELDSKAGVQRHGTINSAAIHRRYTVVTAGHRATDGRPADYSATGRGEWFIKGMAAPTVSLVTDDGAAHPGILSSGSRDGSAVAMSGTSFAAAQFTRLFSAQLAGDDPVSNPKQWAQEQNSRGGLFEKGELTYPGKANIGKVGRGRFPEQHYRGLDRRGR